MATPLVDMLLPEFDHEMTMTRKLLERVPEDRLDWQPHAKSMTLGGLATHIATIPWWGEVTLTRSDVDIAGRPKQEAVTSCGDLLARFDRNVAVTRAALVSISDAELMAPWALKRGTHTVFTMPKASVWRSFMLNHLVHHRGQLTVYLRMQNVPLPSIYGPSADEGGL